ncbi:hypothetical protein N7G274_003284 [Stereocaulon virgatum]|uniref:Uncharacterized protein n=1 Tax=Stereocaulon virgatum TaxID=373712 RepID=A0ABR4AE64_9LECA
MMQRLISHIGLATSRNSVRRYISLILLVLSYLPPSLYCQDAYPLNWVAQVYIMAFDDALPKPSGAPELKSPKAFHCYYKSSGVSCRFSTNMEGAENKLLSFLESAKSRTVLYALGAKKVQSNSLCLLHRAARRTA